LPVPGFLFPRTLRGWIGGWTCWRIQWTFFRNLGLTVRAALFPRGFSFPFPFIS
jgi:hypothetical protein